MFLPARVAHALEEKLAGFRQAAESAARLGEQYLAALDELSRLRPGELANRLAGEEWPGARPTEELEERGLVVPFGRRWGSAREARSWALEKLSGVPTVAVDGSQIAASKELGVPVSLVQVAWFTNYHDPARPYVKDVRDEIVTANQGWSPASGNAGEEFAFAEAQVNQRRFVLEMETAVSCLDALPPEPMPVVFVDASLILSFIRRFWPEYGQPYLQALFFLLDASRERRVPVVGYVDLSFASDLMTMLRTAFQLPAGTAFDAQILAQRMQPFDRTAAFQCARGDVLPLYNTPLRSYADDLCFVYLQTRHDRPPARIDFPRWVLEAGILDRVLDIVRAEVVVGSGYPYALETADAAAVLTTEDRMAFSRLFHELAQAAGLPATLPGKSISKAHRRA